MYSSFKFLSFKQSFKWTFALNESCRSRNFEQLWYSKVFRLRPRRRRKIEFTNWTLEFRVNYSFALTPSPPSLFWLWRRAGAVRRRTPAPSATRRAPALAPSLVPPRRFSVSPRGAISLHIRRGWPLEAPRRRRAVPCAYLHLPAPSAISSPLAM